MICFSTLFSIVFASLLAASSTAFVCFSKDFPEETKLVFYLIWLWLEGNFSPCVRYSYSSVLPDYDADIFVASLLISFCRFSSQILLPVVMISFYILSKRFSLIHKGSFDVSVVSIAKKQCGFL